MRISCNCGKSHHFTMQMAGMLIECPCGQQVVVPSLNKLKQTCPKAVLTRTFSDPSFWKENGCFVCSAPTEVELTAVVHLTPPQNAVIDAEVHPLSCLSLLLFPFLGIFGVLFRPPEPVLIQKAERIYLPIRFCGRCSREMDLDQEVSRQFQKDHIGKELVEDYPDFAIEIARSG
jgi:DNA-directed RNA polymerase subunit RPC12/RpoP